jgi:hypothetical protein
MATTKLFRPIGQGELDLIIASGFKSFPPRLPDQPIFYPVLTKEYAEQIARDWNTKDERSGFIGYVLEFDVDAEYLSRFEVRRVGSDKHLEYWIPAGDLRNSTGTSTEKFASLQNSCRAQRNERSASADRPGLRLPEYLITPVLFTRGLCVRAFPKRESL